MIQKHRGLLPREDGPVLRTMQGKGHEEASDTHLIHRGLGDSEDMDGSKQPDHSKIGEGCLVAT